MKIHLSCAECGSTRFDYPVLMTDDAVVSCADCSHKIGTVRDIQRMVLNQLARRKAVITWGAA